MQFYLILRLAPIALAAEMLVVPCSKFVCKLVSSTHAVDVDGMTKSIDVITCAFHYYFAKQNTPLFGFDFGFKRCILFKISDKLVDRREAWIWQAP